MPTTEIISGLAAVADRYDAVLCDVWGVIHNGETSFSAAYEALARFQATRGPVVLISNAARLNWAVLPQLHALAVPENAYSALVTSGDVTRLEIKARGAAAAWLIGPDRDHSLLNDLPVTIANRPEDADYAICTGLRDDETETPDDYETELKRLVGKPMICANPDRVVQRGDRLIYCGGALADVFQALGGEVVMAGKPYTPIYQSALTELNRLAGRAVALDRVLAIGDGLPTDLAGAQRMGLDCLFVTSGIHAADTQDAKGVVDLAKLERFLADRNAIARYAMAELGWGS